MGRAPAFNLTVSKITESEAQLIMDEVRTEFSFEGDKLDYQYELPDRMDSGNMSVSNDTIYMNYSKGSEYDGTSEEGFLVHYSPYYEESMDSLTTKIEMMKSIRELVETAVRDNNINGEIEFVAATCTV